MTRLGVKRGDVFWMRVLNEPDLFARLPHTLEPYESIEHGGIVIRATWSASVTT